MLQALYNTPGIGGTQSLGGLSLVGKPVANRNHSVIHTPGAAQEKNDECEGELPEEENTVL